MTQGSPEEQQEAVRRRLAESGAAPLPADVAARLDATLARLVEGRSEAGASIETHETLAPVVPLHRRRWPKLVLAAAAVVVAGYGIGAVVNNGTLSGGSADNAATSGSAASSQEGSSGQGSSGNVPAPRRGSAPVALHSGQLPGEVRALLGPRDTVRAPKQDSLSGTKGLEPAGCAPGHLPKHSTWLSATYDGQPAVLVLRPPRHAAEGHSVVAAEVRSCAGRLLDSATVRVP